MVMLPGLAAAGGSYAQAGAAEAEVRKIDAAGAKVTLKHGEIKSLDMPPMTMVYRVKNPAMLARLQVGDKVRFSAEKLGGQYTVTSIEALK
jgi:Cu(I)/Ag(I) efflux system periplasmic protein CusF